jgi:hypothetical protein
MPNLETAQVTNEHAIFWNPLMAWKLLVIKLPDYREMVQVFFQELVPINALENVYGQQIIHYNRSTQTANPIQTLTSSSTATTHFEIK